MQTIQICFKCQLKICLTETQDQENVCPLCTHYLDWSNEYIPFDKSKIAILSQFRMVIPGLLYVIGLPRKYGSETVIRSTKFFGQYGNI